MDVLVDFGQIKFVLLQNDSYDLFHITRTSDMKVNLFTTVPRAP